MSTRSGSAEHRATHRRIAHVLGTICLGLGLALAASLITLAVLARTDQDGISRIAGHPVLTVLSDSMTPTFRAGDLLVDRPASGPATGLDVGDAITFRTGAKDQLVTHRIIAVDRTPAGDVSFRTQGDANNAPDSEPVAPDQVVGVYSARIPYAGYALEAAHSRQGLFLLIVVPLLALLLPVFKKWWQATGTARSEESVAMAEVAVTTGAIPEGRRNPAES